MAPSIPHDTIFAVVGKPHNGLDSPIVTLQIRDVLERGGGVNLDNVTGDGRKQVTSVAECTLWNIKYKLQLHAFENLLASTSL